MIEAALVTAAFLLARSGLDEPMRARLEGMHSMLLVVLGRLDYIERALALTKDDPLASDLHLAPLSQPARRTPGHRPVAGGDPSRAAGGSRRRAYWVPQRLVRGALAFLYFDAGRWDAALAELELIVGPPGPVYHEQLVRGVMAIVAVHRDDVESARRHLAAAFGTVVGSAREVMRSLAGRR